MTKAPFFVEKRLGLLHLIDQSNTIDKNLVIKGSWERAQLEYFSGHIKALAKAGKSVEFWDIGAHAGLYSIYLAKHYGVEIIHAFEPDPRSHAQLHANLFLNELANRIRVHKIAAGEVDEEISFYIADARNRGGSRIGKEGEAKIVSETTVRGARLDNYLKPECDILVLKIDVEGHERRIFEGMPEILRDTKIFMQLEIFEENRPLIIPYLEVRGFRLLQSIEHDSYFSNFDMESVRNET